MLNLRERLLSKLLLPRRVQRIAPTEFHGNAYGGWTISPPVQGIVYSFGVGEDISFEKSLAVAYPVTIFAFDPTPRSIVWIKTQAVPDNLAFLPYGVASHDGNTQFFLPENSAYVSHSMTQDSRQGAITVPVRRLQTIMTLLGHTAVEVMKFDIEGAEYQVLDDFIQSSIRPRQLLVEFHHRFAAAGAVKTWRAVRQLNRLGYRLFSLSPSGEEYGFIKD